MTDRLQGCSCSWSERITWPVHSTGASPKCSVALTFCYIRDARVALVEPLTQMDILPQHPCSLVRLQLLQVSGTLQGRRVRSASSTHGQQARNEAFHIRYALGKSVLQSVFRA